MDFQADTEIYPAGTIIGGGYKILSHLASGGMAHVYIALQSKLSRKVAFKVLSSTFATNVSVSKRFINEALIVAKLHHPHIVEVYDVGETEDHRPFMAMELLEGKGLGARIKEGPMTPAEAFPIVREVAESLAEAHAKGIIHRDLKPDNIFLTVKSGVKTLDFGIAKVLHGENDGTEEKLTRAGTAPGTPEYMSPEQARGQNLDARSDLYSLGIVLYEMLNGKPPFEEPTFLATILMQVQAPPPPLPDTVPAPLANYIINRLLAKDPNCRPSNAEEFIRELDELGQQLKIVVDSDGKTLMNALNEIELLRLQLAQTQQELQRSRDMACIDEADLEGSQTQPQVSVVPVGAPSLGDVSSLVVNPNLGLPAGRSANRASMVPSLVKQGNATAVTSPSGNTTGGAAKSAVQEPSQESFRQIPGNAPITSATGMENQKSGGPMPPHVMPAGRKMPPSSNVGGAKMPPSSNVGGPNTANVAQAGAQPMRSGVMPAMPPNGMGQPMMGGASGAVPMSALNAQAGAQPMRSGVMP
ncbi:MAG: protein kinase, partial [Proteobacteria bacterium]|nr:protein kinase [Pseudomonadota bacterium]